MHIISHSHALQIEEEEKKTTIYFLNKFHLKKLSKHACRLSAMPYICRAEYIPLFSIRKLSELQSSLFYLFSMKNIVHNNVRSLYIPYECNPFVGRRLLIKMEMLFRQRQHRANAKFCLTISIRIWSVLITHGSYLEKNNNLACTHIYEYIYIPFMVYNS